MFPACGSRPLHVPHLVLGSRAAPFQSFTDQYLTCSLSLFVWPTFASVCFAPFVCILVCPLFCLPSFVSPLFACVCFARIHLHPLFDPLFCARRELPRGVSLPILLPVAPARQPPREGQAEAEGFTPGAEAPEKGGVAAPFEPGADEGPAEVPWLPEHAGEGQCMIMSIW